MRWMVCDVCIRVPMFGARAPLIDGRYELFAASADGPAEYVRVQRGRARIPTQTQRTMYINGAAVLMDTASWNCDHCNAEIRPGDPAATITVWRADRPEPPEWESDFVTSSRS